jgi:outer membrane protein/protease secretion system outer membrane protein
MTKRLLLACLLGAHGLAAWPLDLLQAFEAAQANDARLTSARATATAGLERLPQAEAGLLPNLAFSTLRLTNDLSVDNPAASAATVSERYRSSSTNLTLRQPIYRSAQHALVRQARAQTEESAATLRREEQAMAARLVGSYLDALGAQDDVALVAAQKAFYLRQFDAAGRAFAAGSGTRTDIDEVQARLDMVLALELEARQNVGFARRKLQALVGAPVESLAALDPAHLPPSPPMSLDDWISRVEQASPELGAARSQLDAATEAVARARAGHEPTLDAVLSWSRGDHDNVNAPTDRRTNASAGLQLSVPLYSGGAVSSAVRQAQAEQEAARQSLEALRLDLGVRTHKEYRGMTDGTAKIRALEQALRSANQLVLSTQRSYGAGSRHVVDVLNAEQQRASVVRDLAQARSACLMAQVQLLALVEGLNRQAIVQFNASFVN